MPGFGVGFGVGLEKNRWLSVVGPSGTAYWLVTDDGTPIVTDDGDYIATDLTTIVVGTDDGTYLVTDAGVWIKIG
jgi:hypothetical protein